MRENYCKIFKRNGSEYMKYNIGLFNDSFPPTIDGVANTVYNYANIITKNGGNCTVVTPRFPNVIDDYDFDVVRYSSLPISKKFDYRLGNILPVKSLSILKEKNFDIIHVHAPFVSSLVANELVGFSKKNIPVVFTYHTKFDVEFEKRMKLKPFKKISTDFVRKNINLADEVWVVSEGAAESLRNIGYKGDYRVMRNGTDFKIGKSSEDKIKKLKMSLDIMPEEIVLLFVGRMMWYKNIRLILKAIKRMPSDIKIKMVFVGDGSDRAAIEQYAKQLNIYDKCCFAGAVYDRERLRDYYSIGDLFLFPSTYDTSGLVVMEAAATGLPSVLIKCSCASEGVYHNQNGFLCEENSNSLKETILEAISDLDKLKQIGINAQNELYCSWEDSVKAACKRYEEIIEEHRIRRLQKSRRFRKWAKCN